MTSPAVAKLEKGQKAYIALAADGAYGGKVYPRTGLQTSQFIAQGLLPYVAESSIAAAVETAEEVLSSARKAGARYAFIPHIVNWEPRVAAWSMRPARGSVTVTVLDVPSGNTLIKHEVSVKGRSMTFVSQHADELMREAVKLFCQSLF